MAVVGLDPHCGRQLEEARYEEGDRKHRPSRGPGPHIVADLVQVEGDRQVGRERHQQRRCQPEPHEDRDSGPSDETSPIPERAAGGAEPADDSVKACGKEYVERDLRLARQEVQARRAPEPGGPPGIRHRDERLHR